MAIQTRQWMKEGVENICDASFTYERKRIFENLFSDSYRPVLKNGDDDYMIRIYDDINNC